MIASVRQLADSESGDSEDGLADACRWQDVGRMIASVCQLADSESGDSADGLVDACRCQDVVRCSPLFASLLIPSQETRRTDLSMHAASKLWPSG